MKFYNLKVYIEYQTKVGGLDLKTQKSDLT